MLVYCVGGKKRKKPQYVTLYFKFKVRSSREANNDSAHCENDSSTKQDIIRQ